MKKSLILLTIVLVISLTCEKENIDPNDNPEEPLRLLWKYAYDINGYPRMPPAVIGDSLIIMAGDEYLTSLRIGDGSLKWRSFVDTTVRLDNNHLLHDIHYAYAAHIEDIRVYDISTGVEVWRQPLKNDRGQLGFSYHSISPGTMYVAGYSQVHAISIFTDIFYTVDLKGGTKSVLYYNGKLYVGQYWFETVYQVGTYDYGRITCLDAATGDSLWAFDTDGAGPTYSPLILDEGVLYFGTVRSGQLSNFAIYAIDAENGEKLWQTDRISTYHAIIVGDYIYGNTGGSAFKLNKHTGELLWNTPFSGHGERPVAYLGGYLYHTHSNVLKIIDTESGEIVYMKQAPDGTAFRLVSTGSNRVFVQSSAHLYCYEPFDPEALNEE